MYGMSSQRAQLSKLVVKRLLAFQETQASIEGLQEALGELDTHHQNQMQLLEEIQKSLSSPQPADASQPPADKRVRSALP